MHFVSILEPDGVPSETASPPVSFPDLNLDQVIAAITAPKEPYALPPIFYAPLESPEAIHFRQAVMRDVERPEVLSALKDFASKMRSVRIHLHGVQESYHEPAKRAWFLDAVDAYCDGTCALDRGLDDAGLRSVGMRSFREYLAQYVGTSGFKDLHTELAELRSALAAIRYGLSIRGNAIAVRPIGDTVDYALEVVDTFERFRQGDVQDYTVKLPEGLGMSYVEAQIVAFVAKLYPEPFARLERFYQQHQDFTDPTIVRFDREVQFYVAYVDYMAPFKEHGLPFCYPEVATDNKNIWASGAYDLALAGKLADENRPIVCNDFQVADPERILVVTGPNQGGKTTFARMFGQLHYLASLGCPVPAQEARLLLYDQIFTHFEREEHVAERVGKLQDDLLRVHEILSRATSRSVILLNEIFSSTSFEDAAFLAQRVLEAVREMGALCVVVTFIDEPASLSEEVVSLVGTVLPDRPDIRTYRIVRRAADGLAYAIALAEKHRLTKEQLKERIRS